MKTNTKQEILWYEKYQEEHNKVKELKNQIKKVIEVVETCAIPSPFVKSAKTEIHDLIIELNEVLGKQA